MASTAQSALVARIATVSATETDLQKLAYAAKGLAALEPTGSTDLTNYYGLSWDESADTYVRTGSATAAIALPIQSRMRRCLLNDAGEVVSYLHPLNSAYTEAGGVADLTGVAGQVMVEVPKFYQRYSYVGTRHTWDIAEQPLAGFSVHPAFIKNGVEVPYRYTSAYEASLSTTKIASVSGVLPKTTYTRAQFRAAAVARGAGWRQYDYYTHSALQLLALVEFGSFNIKGAIGAGRVNLSGGSWVVNSYLALTGLSNSFGNGSGSVALGTTLGYLTDVMSYRGVENFWGHVWKFVDGMTVDATANDTATAMPIWVTNDSAYFADTGSTGMTKLWDMTNFGAANLGYTATLRENIVGFMPDSLGGTDTTKARQHTWQYGYDAAATKPWRAPYVGADANDGAVAGPLALFLGSASGDSGGGIGARAGF